MPNQETTLRLYPRGFMGGTLKPQVRRTPQRNSKPLNSLSFRVEDQDKKAITMTAHPRVEQLYSLYIRNTVSVQDFDCRKSVLECALHVFGSNDFELWMNAQYSSPAPSRLLHDFLNDIVKFLKSGTRDMSNEVWARLLHITDEGNNIDPMNNEMKKFLSDKENCSLINVIQKWCSHPNGLQDLLMSLHVMFGQTDQ